MIFITGATICQRPPRVSNGFISEQMTKAAHEFYLGSTPKTYDERQFLYRVMGGHVGNTRKFIQNPDPQGYIYDANDNVTMGVLPREPVLGETRAWDMKYMLDIPNFECDEEKQADVVQVVLFNDKHIDVNLYEWKYVNGLMNIQDKANSPSALWIFETDAKLSFPSARIGHWKSSVHSFASG